MANEVWFQGIEHGWIGRIAHSSTGTVAADERRVRRLAKRRRFNLFAWSRSAILGRGGSFGRDDARLYSDLQAARDAREDGR